MQRYNLLLPILQDELETDKLINIYKIGENLLITFYFNALYLKKKVGNQYLEK